MVVVEVVQAEAAARPVPDADVEVAGVAEEGVVARQGAVELADVVARGQAQVAQVERVVGACRLQVGLEDAVDDPVVEVRREAVGLGCRLAQDRLVDVAAVAREVAVVGQDVEAGAGGAACRDGGWSVVCYHGGQYRLGCVDMAREGGDGTHYLMMSFSIRGPLDPADIAYQRDQQRSLRLRVEARS